MKELNISCIGDSLTAGSPGYRYDDLSRFGYQYWLRDYIQKNSDLMENYNIYFQNYGVPGATMGRILEQASFLEEPDWVIILGGTNDFWMFSSPTDMNQNEECVDDVIMKLKYAVKECRERGSKDIILCSIPPVYVGPVAPPEMHENIRATNKWIEENYKTFEVSFADVYRGMCNSRGVAEPSNFQDDGVHFTESGNRACGYAIGKIFTIYYKALGA